MPHGNPQQLRGWRIDAESEGICLRGTVDGAEILTARLSRILGPWLVEMVDGKVFELERQDREGVPGDSVAERLFGTSLTPDSRLSRTVP